MTEKDAHILVVDDDDRLRSLISRYLREQGFAVSTAEHAQAARSLLGLFAFDLMVLDVMMPGDEDGMALARALKEESSVPLPVLMLSARGETEDRVAGLEAGVDDYLTKPFDPKELSLRIRAILRRAAPATFTECRFGDYVFHLASATLLRGRDTVYLTSSEAAMLKTLAEAAGSAVDRDKLALIAGQDGSAERAVDVQITRLRKKIEPDGTPPRYIQTVRGAGYVLQGVLA